MDGCKPVYSQGWTDERKLLMKMVEIYKQVQYIQKRGKNKFHGYSYATEADVNERVREEMSQRNIIMMPGVVNKELRNTTTRSGNTEYIYRVDMEFNFMDAETGESLVVPMSGEGQDVGDKAIFKAISGCQKYALMKAFMIPTGDDPEGDEGVDERNNGKAPVIATQPTTSSAPHTNSNPLQNASTGQSGTSADVISEKQAGMIFAKWKSSKHKELPKPDVCELISAELGKTVSDFKDIAKTDINKVIKWFEDAAA